MKPGGHDTADVCLILEGTYPYVTGGVSSWTHDLLLAQNDLTFHLVTLLPQNADLTVRYRIPSNVRGTSKVIIQDLREGESPTRHIEGLLQKLEHPLLRLQSRGGLQDLKELLGLIGPHRAELGRRILLNSRGAWEMLTRLYNSGFSTCSLLDYFWSWRALLGGLYSVLFADIPPARVYHTVSTGYAGLLAARAHVETGRPAIVTEHGIYTNERRLEIAMANWLHDKSGGDLRIGGSQRMLKDLWVDTFIGYSRVCYEACSEVITLYAGNQQLQLQDGAPESRLRIIPNGIDYDRYASISKDPAPRPPVVALIGRIVPIKDVKTFLRAAAMLRASVPDVKALVMGPTDEDPEYYADCKKLVKYLGLENTVEFTGRVNLTDYLGRIDVVVLTSLSEAQPLVILEAGAAGVPLVATDVGACREMILGRPDERPALGPGGAITPLCNPSATAQELAALLTDREQYNKCSRAIRQRTRTQYNKNVVDRTYRELYEKHIEMAAAWQE
jgi:glycosyltransferase involved in cell wall biosynthesis